jgi:hypothetical protein
MMSLPLFASLAVFMVKLLTILSALTKERDKLIQIKLKPE